MPPSAAAPAPRPRVGAWPAQQERRHHNQKPIKTAPHSRVRARAGAWATSGWHRPATPASSSIKPCRRSGSISQHSQPFGLKAHPCFPSPQARQMLCHAATIVLISHSQMGTRESYLLLNTKVFAGFMLDMDAACTLWATAIGRCFQHSSRASAAAGSYGQHSSSHSPTRSEGEVRTLWQALRSSLHPLARSR